MAEERHKLRVLVVDDDEAIRLSLIEVLRKAGCRVLVASDGIEAIKILDTAPVDIVITDNHMPRMSGLDLIRWIQAVLPRVPAVLISGHELETVTARGGERGAVRVLRKPFTEEALLLLVGELCGTALCL